MIAVLTIPFSLMVRNLSTTFGAHYAQGKAATVGQSVTRPERIRNTGQILEWNESGTLPRMYAGMR
jgi:hypothetical protein